MTIYSNSLCDQSTNKIVHFYFIFDFQLGIQKEIWNIVRFQNAKA